MNNTLKRLEANDFVSLLGDRTVGTDYTLYEKQFEEYRKSGFIVGDFKDDRWLLRSELKNRSLNFDFDEELYREGIQKEIRFSYEEMKNLIKYYVIYTVGEFPEQGLQANVKNIKRFIEDYDVKKYDVTYSTAAIRDFFHFIDVSYEDTERILERVPDSKPCRTHRTLSRMINYLAIDAELTDMYSSDITDEEFVKWFPVYFWCKVSFVVPLRPTEICVTPYDCLKRNGNEVYLRVRRTRLKKKTKVVYYEVDKDYEIFEYEVPYDETIKTIEKYLRLTEGERKRKFLFLSPKKSSADYLTAIVLGGLLTRFVETKLNDNPKYDYCLYVSGEERFSAVNPGDSRPIAMANLFYQDVSSDVCRQLAGHENTVTSEGYYTNVSNTILASSTLRYQRLINARYLDLERAFEKRYEYSNESECLAPSRPLETGNVDVCVKEGRLESCVGCRYYVPSEESIRKELERREESLRISCERILESTALSFDADLLEFRKAGYRYSKTCDELNKAEVKKWVRAKSTTRIS